MKNIKTMGKKVNGHDDFDFAKSIQKSVNPRRINAPLQKLRIRAETGV